MTRFSQKWPTMTQLASVLFWRAKEIDGGPVRCAVYVWPTRSSDETRPRWAVEIGAPGTEYIGSFAGCSHLTRHQSYRACMETAREMLTHAREKRVWGGKEVSDGEAV